MKNYEIFARTVESSAYDQIKELANSPLGVNANIRIMPDCHSGKGCVIGTTMKIIDKVCPNLVGVDIGCGVTLAKTDINFKNHLQELDNFIRRNVPYGQSTYYKDQHYTHFEKMYSWSEMSSTTQTVARASLGTLGGGNHFIEAYDNGYLAVHSGSRNLGFNVAKHYQLIAECQKPKLDLTDIPEKEREAHILAFKEANKIPKHLKYLTGDTMKRYLHDIKILQQFATDNRNKILSDIIEQFSGKESQERINSIHNYIDVDSMILRKGAISAQKGENLVIPMNMRDGLLLCIGKGNKDWNYSAPHGAGRLYSRSRAKQEISLEDFQESMKGIFSTSVCESTIDESPFAYKDYKEIMECIEPTVEILERLIPIYNFKA